MSVIWKFALNPVKEQTLQMPAGAKVLHVAVQYDNLYLWAQCDTDVPKEDRSFLIFGTGHEVDDSKVGDYLGTGMIYGGQIVCHVFEARRK